MRKAYFDECAELLVRKFREVDAAGAFVSSLLVAKEGRFHEDMAPARGIRTVIDFYQNFCDTQRRAEKLASVFNEKLARLPTFVPGVTPTIAFLDCSV